MKGALLAVLAVMGMMPLHAADRTPFELTTLLGETYHNCRIIKATPAGLTVVYDAGVAKVPFEILGDTWRDLYHYDPEKARRYNEHEEAKRIEGEARLRKVQHSIEVQRNKQMNALVKAEAEREAMETRLLKEQAEAAAKASGSAAPPASSPPPPAPFPGDPVPVGAPISNPYTPNQPVTSETSVGTTGVDWTTGNVYTGGYVPYVYTPGYVVPPPRMRPPLNNLNGFPSRGGSSGLGGRRSVGPGVGVMPGRGPFH